MLIIYHSAKVTILVKQQCALGNKNAESMRKGCNCRLTVPCMYLFIHFVMVVKMGVLTNNIFCFILLISQLMTKAIPVRGARF
ncbi:hypothetical protein GD488_25475 [Salmonella enterica]|nr:hypothetical protein [Salmonella enterica]